MTLRPRLQRGPLLLLRVCSFLLCVCLLLAASSVLLATPARAATLAGAVASPAATAVVPAEPHASGPGAQPLPNSRVAVLVDRLDPASPQPTDTLQVAGTVLNRAAEQFDRVEISLHLGRPVGGRSALQQQRTDPVAEPLATRPAKLGAGTLAPGARVPFSISTPVATLLTAGAGVYPLQVTVVGHTTEGFRDLGSADTFLPYVPSATAGGSATTAASPPAPLPVAWVLPITDRPRLAASGGISDDDLTASLADGGRLDDILAAAGTLPAATTIVDPALLRAVSIMASGRYAVGLSSMSAERQPDPQARAWLQRLLASARTGGTLDVVPTAFADADLERLLHDGRSDLVQQVTDRSTSALREVLGSGGDGRLVVPAAGRLDEAGARYAVGQGAVAALLDPDAVAPTRSVRSGAGGSAAASTAGGTGGTSPPLGLESIVPDATLRALLRAGPQAAPSPRLAEQSVLAELAQAYLTPRTPGAPLVLAPGPDWAPTQNWAAQLAALTVQYPWLHPIGLTDLLGDVQRGGGTVGLTYTAADRAAELPSALVPPVGGTLNDVDGFAEALPRGTTVTRSVVDTALSALSADFRGDPAGSTARQQSAAAGLDALRGAVRVVASREVTLTSRNGRIPVTLENNLPDAIDVTMRLTSLDRSRVQSDTSVSRVIQPGQKVQVEVEVRATSAGTFPVRLVLLTPTGRPIGAPQQVLVRSTAAGLVAKGVTVAALAVLLLIVLGRAVRALWRRRGLAKPPPSGRADGSSDSSTGTSSVSA